MPVSLIHLSDIHFGQESGSELYIHNDVKVRLIEDAAAQVMEHASGAASGVIVTGDIAYSGQRAQYTDAAAWLDELTVVIGCEQTAVQVVPGNHDIDRGQITHGCRMMLDSIAADGESQLDELLKAEQDRQALYNRFSAYRPFAEGYNCPLDGGGGIASLRRYELAPGRHLRVIGLNSALICSLNDTKGRLLLGARQRVLPRNPGEELVVLSHHPLDWLQDSEDARRYVRNRARVFVSGHEHNPSLNIDNIGDGCELMMLAAGATVPPKIENGFPYTYNLLSFAWHPASDGLEVTIVPRVWSEEKKDFEQADHRLGGRQRAVVLGCPNFRAAPRPDAAPPRVAPTNTVSLAKATPPDTNGGGGKMPEDVPLLLLNFFRDLSPAQRLEVLVKLKALPDDWPEPLTHAMERRAFDRLVQTGRTSELRSTVTELLQQ